MERKHVYTFHKSERLCGKRATDALFAGGNKAMVLFPVRTVFMTLPRKEKEPPVSVLVSVSKRHFKRAVKRNRVKRQIRETYRKHKHILLQTLDKCPEKRIAVAFLWLSDDLYETGKVETCIRHLLVRIAERVAANLPESRTHE